MAEEKQEKQVRLGDLPSELMHTIRPTVHCYCVSLVYKRDLEGSGTLVKCGDRHGILTAGHVCSNERHQFDFSPTSEDRLGLVIKEEDHRFWVSMSSITPYPVGTTGEKQQGPDMTFLEIPPGEDLDKLVGEKAFYDIDSKPDAHLAFCQDDDHGLWAVAGAVCEQMVEEEVNEQTTRIGVKNTVWFTGPHGRCTEGDFDYIEVGVKHDDLGEVPTSFAGLSGGGLWKIPLHGKMVDEKETLIAENPVLAGLAYFHFYPEGRFDQSGFGRLKCHGPGSIYENLRRMLSE